MKNYSKDKQTEINDYFVRLTGIDLQPYKVYESRLIIMEKENE